jgi:nuclear pore complex protein Nup98-Nup96
MQGLTDKSFEELRFEDSMKAQNPVGGGGGFGMQQPAATTGGFGAGATNKFGTTGGLGLGSPNKFGTTSATSGGFGGGAFGTGGGIGGGLGGGGIGGGGGFGQQNSQVPNFQPVPCPESVSAGNGRTTKVTSRLMAISAMQGLTDKSFEELRFEDSMKAQNPVGGGGGFGQAQNQLGGGFGQKTQSPGLGFGGQAPTSGGFGQAGAGAGAFGQKPAGGGFGASTQAPATSGFGGGLKFGAQSQAPATGGFGQSSTGGFGQKPAVGGFGSPSQTTSTGGFGSAGGFGKPAATGTGGFGGFGGQTQAPATGGFGSAGAGGFGANKGTGFGANAQASPAKTGAGFGSAGGFGAAKSPAAGTTNVPSFGQFGSATTGGGFGAGGATGGGFGAGGAKPGGFGASTGTTGFGSKTGGFGSPGATTTGGFGAKTGGFGSPGATTTGGFGGGFGTGTAGTGGGGGGFGMGSGGFGAANQQNVAITEPLPEPLEFDVSGLERPDSSTSKSKDGAAPVYSKTQTSYRYIPRSAARIQPRGLHSESSKSHSSSGTTILDPSSLQGEKRDQLRIGYQVSSAVKYLENNTDDVVEEHDEGAEDGKSFINSVGTNDDKPTSHVVETPKSKGGSIGGDATGLTPSTEILSPYIDEKSHSTDRNKMSLLVDSASSEGPKSSSKSKLLVAPKPIKFPIKPDSPSSSCSPPKSSVKQINVHAPILTKKGYDCHPSIQELQRMTDDELGSVKNFVIFRPGLGQIKWEGQTDVRDLNLDEIVVIENKMISVYDDIQENDKPPRGTELNKPAVVTLYQICPKTITAEAIEKFEKKLQKSCNKNGSEFLHYDVDLEEWMFRVKHF